MSRTDLALLIGMTLAAVVLVVALVLGWVTSGDTSGEPSDAPSGERAEPEPCGDACPGWVVRDE